MSSTNHPNPRQSLLQFKPVCIKQSDELTGVHAGHACCRWMKQPALDLRMLQELLRDSPHCPCLRR